MTRTGRIAIILLGLIVTGFFPGAEEQVNLPAPVHGLSPVFAEQTETPRADYVIGCGDILGISVWKEDALTKVVTVLPDGKISFPLIGEVTASGKTVVELQTEMKRRIQPHLPDPDLWITVQEPRSMVIYGIGRVNNPGRFGLHTRINVMQALAMAGGLNTFAKRTRIRLFRETEGETKIFPFNYDSVSEGEKIEQNILVKRGDFIVVP